MMNKKTRITALPALCTTLDAGRNLLEIRGKSGITNKGLREGSDIGQLVNCQIKNIKSTSWPYQGGGQRGAGCNPVFLFIKSMSH